jgi:hypothetical protein
MQRLLAKNRKKSPLEGFISIMNPALACFLALILSATASLRADDSAPLLNKPGKLISQPDFKGPLGKEWSVGKGKWDAADGVITVSDIPEEKHIPVLHLATGPVPVILDCEFRYNTGKGFLVGFDGAGKHCGRVVINPKKVTLCEDSTEVKGKTPSHVLAEMPVDLKSDAWQKLHVEYAGDKLAIRLNGKELTAEHAYLAMPKVRWWFAAQAGEQVRNVRVTEGVPLQAPAAPAK